MIRLTERSAAIWIRTRRYSAVVLLVAAVVWTAGRAWGIGFVLGQTKEELKLKYDVAVEEHSFDGAPTGRVTVVLTLVDEGRLKPLDEVQLVIPGKEKNKDGSRWMDLVVPLDMTKTADGKRVGRVHILREFAERAEIQLNTHTMDGKMDPLTRLHHVVPIAKYLKSRRVGPAQRRPTIEFAQCSRWAGAALVPPYALISIRSGPAGLCGA